MELRTLRYFVAVAEEQNIGRAAARLQMTQPPLSRAMRQLADDLGVELFQRVPTGVRLTPAGLALHREARAVLDRVARLPGRVIGVDNPTITVGTCGDTADQVGSGVVTTFRRDHPQVELTLRETDLTDPTAGLRDDLVDVALTRRPFDETDIATRRLRADPVGVVVLESDPLARQPSVRSAELRDRRWRRLPEGVDRRWCEYWLAGGAGGTDAASPVVRTIQECLRSVLWTNAATLAPLVQPLPEGLTNVPISDKDPSEVVVAWRPERVNPLVRSFVDIAVRAYAGRC